MLTAADNVQLQWVGGEKLAVCLRQFSNSVTAHETVEMAYENDNRVTIFYNASE